MTVKIYKSNYKDKCSVALENDCMKVQFLPELGGKMASLICKRTSREVLAQGNNENYKVLAYDGDYVAAECSGFDDMFPTIDRVYYNDYPWKGIEIPDHGEVCGLSWDYKIEDDCLYMYVHGVRFPYKLEKWVRFDPNGALNIKYRATNFSEFDMDFIWAAHPMINAEEGGEIILPYEDNEDIKCVFTWDENLGKYGDSMKWPVTKQKDGSFKKINITPERSLEGNNYKYYFDNRMPEGWCAYKYKSTDTVVSISFPVKKVPYLTIWINEGSFHGFHNIAMEPCTGTYDRIDLAKIHKQNSVLKAKGEYSWFLNFHIEQYSQFKEKRRDIKID